MFIEHPLCARTTLSALCLSNLVVTRGCEVSVATALSVRLTSVSAPHSQSHTGVWLLSLAFYSATLSPGRHFLSRKAGCGGCGLLTQEAR